MVWCEGAPVFRVDFMSFFSDIFKPDAVPTSVPPPTDLRQLVLYKSDACGYCARVQRVIKELELDVEVHDVLWDRSMKAELIERTRRGTVPCLFIDDVALHESRDIVAWLRAYASNRQAT